MLRYSDREIFSQMEEDPQRCRYYSGNATNPRQFNMTLSNLMNSLAIKAVSSSTRFATGYENLEESRKLYGLVQCTPNIHSYECSICLRDRVADIPQCCNGKQGGVLYTPSCYIRFETYPFYHEASQPGPSPPPPTTSSTGHGKISSKKLLQLQFLQYLLLHNIMHF
ncbi:cysteine-rich receptor-like protein kinase 25 [Pistacia vera]|uniref:cysteine-rich receptor-like protein kinase 25 n=1 Tax=Pistacia vera TaxID=55513 RepID=UPI001263825F|nr:cysteine-rich receptor-like protein kinase 25 [Pistacia vera]